MLEMDTGMGERIYGVMDKRGDQRIQYTTTKLSEAREKVNISVLECRWNRR
jgi:hypothetical protein